MVSDAAHPDANIIFGAVIDDTLGDEVRVTVIAAGFDGGAPTRRATPVVTRRVADETPIAAAAATASAKSADEQVIPVQEPTRPIRKVVFDDAEGDDLDVPDFLK